jgi:calcineurin-like phosphoesterase family protein
MGYFDGPATYDKFTSDQHFGHLRIPELATRPFECTPEGIEAMNAELIRRHNSVTGTTQKVAHLGDFAMGTIANTLPTVALLNGVHTLYGGNHDRCTAMYGRSKMEFWATRYHDAGLKYVFTGGENEAATGYADVFGTLVAMCHFPYRGAREGDSQQEERFSKFRPEWPLGAEWLLCGHVHGAWRQRGRMINVGVDAWGGYPVSADEIAALISQGPADREPLQW